MSNKTAVVDSPFADSRSRRGSRATERVLHLFSKFDKGPHGSVVAGVFVASAAVLCMLAASMAFEAIRGPAGTIALGAILLAQFLGIVLLNRVRAKLNDVHYALALEAGMRRAGYDPVDFFTDGAAGNPSLQLLQLKILRFCKPQRILELGSGQTTKLLSCYARANPTAYVLTLEQDNAWFRRLQVQITHDYRYVPLERKQVSCAVPKLSITTLWYRDVPELHGNAFDYILVDGPDHGTLGTEHTSFSRSGILHYMPALLAPSFVVVFDDAERYGEIMTVKALENILVESQIRYVRFAINGIKTQIVVCSPDYSFLEAI